LRDSCSPLFHLIFSFPWHPFSKGFCNDFLREPVQLCWDDVVRNPLSGWQTIFGSWLLTVAGQSLDHCRRMSMCRGREIESSARHGLEPAGTRMASAQAGSLIKPRIGCQQRALSLTSNQDESAAILNQLVIGFRSASCDATAHLELCLGS